MLNYLTSNDYVRLKGLLDQGNDVICFSDYDRGDGSLGRAVCMAYKEDEKYSVRSLGVEYLYYYPGMKRFKSFEEACANNNIEFLEPTK